jgi:hypothetical protein
MIQPSFFESLHEQGFISAESLEKIRQKQRDSSISLFWDVRILLYAGVLLLTGGLGVLIYKNIDSIGHLAVIVAMTIMATICYVFALRRRNPFSWNEVRSPGTIFDYTLLLGSILMVTLVGYVQYQYKVFGTEWKLATFIPMVILFITAYYFDNQALLSMAIVNLAAWLGITINEKIFLATEQINNKATLITATLLGVALILASIASRITARKPHFHRLYHLFGTHMYFLSAFIALFVFQPEYYIWVFIFLVGAVYHFIKAKRENSYYYMVITLIYLYGCFGFVALDVLDKLFTGQESTRSKIAVAYFTVSAIVLIFLLISQNKKFRKNAGV